MQRQACCTSYPNHSLPRMNYSWSNNGLNHFISLTRQHLRLPYAVRGWGRERRRRRKEATESLEEVIRSCLLHVGAGGLCCRQRLTLVSWRCSPSSETWNCYITDVCLVRSSQALGSKRRTCSRVVLDVSKKSRTYQVVSTQFRRKIVLSKLLTLTDFPF